MKVLKFVCPKCGGHYFGTSNCNEDFSKWIGHCHSYDENCKPCDFTWKREKEDKNVIKFVEYGDEA